VHSVTVRPADVAEAAKLEENKDYGAVSYTFNLIYVWDHLQLGLSAGADHLFDNEKENWFYQDRGWLSFGIGINLFKASED
jgi:hypothetical protein